MVSTTRRQSSRAMRGESSHRPLTPPGMRFRTTAVLSASTYSIVALKKEKVAHLLETLIPKRTAQYAAIGCSPAEFASMSPLPRSVSFDTTLL
jgi:hypothetical protein